MQASSRESYAAAADRLAALDADAPALAGTADDVLGVAALLAREPRLRRALSDPARSAEDRAALLRDLMGDQVGEQATELVSTLVAGRWSRPSELLDATERLGVDVLLSSADKAGTLADVEDELFRFGQVVQGDERLGAALGDSTVDASRRAELTGNLLAGKADPVTVRLVELAVAGFGGRPFAGGLGRLVELAAERRARQVAYVTVAAPLSEDDERQLGDKLSELYGRKVSLKITVDPRILGGVSVQVGHDLYDGTVIRRLNETRIALAGR
jgi:F-type H+-transporting ATPase subunit delta